MAASVVEPVDAFEGGELNVFVALPGSVWIDELPLVERVERLDHRIVKAIAFGADRGDDAVVGRAAARSGSIDIATPYPNGDQSG